MNQKFKKLNTFVGLLTEAFEKNDWEEVAKLDLSAKTIVSECSSLLVDDAEKEMFRKILLELQSLYSRLESENRGRRTELGSELKKLHKERNAINQYIQSSGY